LCRSLLLYECVERDVYRFGVEDVEITEVAECKAPEGLSVRLERFQVMAIVRGAAQGASS
jgi:hypothetical protein